MNIEYDTIPRVSTRMDLIRMLPPDSEGAEVGVWEGGFSAEILTTPVRKLHLVDAWEHQPGHPDNALSCPQNDHNRRETLVMERFKDEIANNRVVVHRGLSMEVVRHIPVMSLDWVFIDADHTFKAVYNDLTHWMTRVKPGGVILGHDFMEEGVASQLQFGVIPAVEQFCLVYGWKITHLTKDDEWPSYRLGPR